jgi:predicted metal-dependent hydrolase
MAKSSVVGSISFHGEPVTVTRKAIKHLHLRIKPLSGEICVSAPYRLTDREILDFLSKHSAWIERHRAACGKSKEPPPLCDGASVLLFGNVITLRIVKGKGTSYSFDGTTLTVFHQGGAKPLGTSLTRFYRDRLEAAVEPMLKDWSRRLELPLPTLRYRAMTSRWGSCHVGKRIVTLNLRLAFYPAPLLEYVLVHELMHLYHPNHSPAFYAALASRLPDFRERKRRLEDLARQNSLPDPFLR